MLLSITSRSWEIKKDKHKDAKIVLFKIFVLDGNKLSGSHVCAANKDMLLEDGVRKSTVYAVTKQNVNDKNISLKDLQCLVQGLLMLTMQMCGLQWRNKVLLFIWVTSFHHTREAHNEKG
jgi:hypothetical protein